LLLSGEDNPSMRLVLRHIACMEAIEVPHIETAQHNFCQHLALRIGQSYAAVALVAQETILRAQVFNTQ
jgi:hypothetical protein